MLFLQYYRLAVLAVVTVLQDSSAVVTVLQASGVVVTILQASIAVITVLRGSGAHCCYSIKG